MAAAVFNPIDLKIGDTYPAITFTYTDGSDNPLNFADGTVALAQLRSSTGKILYTWRSADETAVIAANVLTLNAIPDVTTEAFIATDPGTFECQITDLSSGTTTQYSGSINFIQDLAE